eukprot:CAMPEP_0184708978 /NCGR_PEP_ID=MMETSP0314-20130426/193_1 /TAXON_ID=38298 /ORGANISM="Rhodella maculata, Strain CCMP 736" /LENGTH=142 /DNA_ID=CAMNT_0027170605 /DNA_START=33 /DNA_END=462 /DNA_ORIENTATION=+
MPLVEYDAQQVGSGGKVIPAGRVKAIRAAANSGIAGVETAETVTAAADGCETNTSDAKNSGPKPRTAAAKRKRKAEEGSTGHMSLDGEGDQVGQERGEDGEQNDHEPPSEESFIPGGGASGRNEATASRETSESPENGRGAG